MRHGVYRHLGTCAVGRSLGCPGEGITPVGDEALHPNVLFKKGGKRLL